MRLTSASLSDLPMTCLRVTLRRCPSQELYRLLERWNYLPKSTIHNFKTFRINMKSLMVVEVLKLCQQMQITMENAALLDLMYHQMKGTGTWKVYRMVKEHDKHKLLNADSLKDSLDKSLSKLYKTNVTISIYNGAVWYRIMTTEYNLNKNLYQLNISFLVHFPTLPIILVKYLKDPLFGIVMEEILDCMGFSDYKRMQLSGRHVNSLATMALNKFSQTKSSLLLKHSKKRKVTEVLEDEDNIFHEQRNQKEKKEEVIEKVLGRENLPILENINFSMTYPNEDKFYGLNSKVQFSGPHVLEGLQDMIETEKIQHPLPNYLSQLLLLGRDQIILGCN